MEFPLSVSFQNSEVDQSVSVWPPESRDFSPFQSAQNLPRQEFQNLKKFKNQKEKDEDFQKKKNLKRILIVRNPGKISKVFPIVRIPHGAI